MAYEPDKVVVELIAKTDNFDGKVKQSASTNEQAMNKIVADAGRAEAAVTRGSSARSNALQRESKQIASASKMIGDNMTSVSALLTSPSSPFVTIPKQAPAVSNAMKVVSVASGVLGGVLGGVVAAGATLAISKLMEMAEAARGTEGKIADLVAKLKENAEKTDLARTANQIFAETLEGVTQAIRDDEEALKKLNSVNETAARLALVNANRRLITLQGIRDETLAHIDNARAILESQRARASGPTQQADLAALDLPRRQADLDRLEQRLGRVDGLIKRQTARVQEALAFRVVELVQQQADPLEAIKQKYDGPGGLIEKARQRAIAEGTVATKLADQVRELEKARKLEEEAARKAAAAARRTPREERQSGRQITEAQARSIVASIGGTVTSGFRTPEHNKKVGGDANSFHLKGQAIDIAKTAGLTLTKIVQAFEKQGVRLIEKLDEGDHFHIAFGRRGGARGPSAETLAQRALAQADAAERREQAFQNEKASLQSDELEARQALITSQEEIAKLELAAIEISRAKYEDNVKSLIETRKLTAQEGEELLKINNERAKLRAELVQRRERERAFREQEAAAQRAVALSSATLENEAELLRTRQNVARTQKERADIERRLLDIQFQEERIALEAVIAHNERLKLNKDALESDRIEAQAAATIAQIRLDSLAERQANAQAAGDRANASPLQAYFGDIQAQADDLNTAFETIAAGGLSNFVDRLTDAIVNFRSLADVGRAVLAGLTADLVKLAIRMVLNATIGKLVGKVAAVSSATQGAAVAAAWAPAAAAVSLATLGANAGPALAALTAVNTAALGFAAAGAAAGAGGGFAQGGRITGPGTPTSDSIPINASVDEFMVRAASAKKVGYDVLEHINRYGSMPLSGANLRAISPSKAVAATGGGGSDLAGLRDIIRDAVNAGINAMPSVSLYASLDPVDVLQRALGTRAGEKALIAALGRNSSGVKAQLQ